MIYRDDDINRFTDIQVFMAIHDLFLKNNKIHTCVCEMKDLWESRGLWHLLMTLPNLEIALHCWEHIDYSELSYEQARVEIGKAISYFNEKTKSGYGKVIPIKTLFPPWNRVSDNLKKACDSWGIRLDNRHSGDVFAFHWWECINPSVLKELEGKLK